MHTYRQLKFTPRCVQRHCLQFNTLPPPPRDYVYVNSVTGGCVGDHILQDCFTMHVARFIANKIASSSKKRQKLCDIAFQFYASDRDIGCTVAM